MFEPLFMRLALVASVATGASLGLIGVYLVMRRVVFFGLVLANVATVGAALGQVIEWNPEVLSLASAVTAAIVLGGAGSSRVMSPEALMGWGYAAAASATVLILAWSPGGSTDTFHLLFGNVLTVDTDHVVMLALIAIAAILLQVVFGRRFLLVTFDAESARVAGVNTRGWSLLLNLLTGVAVATAVNHIGVLSTFALLTLPATAALVRARSLRSTFVIAGGLGVLLSSLALIVSFYLDLPAGPTSVALQSLAVPVAALRRSERASVDVVPDVSTGP